MSVLPLFVVPLSSDLTSQLNDFSAFNIARQAKPLDFFA
jgi:hypothetical protein